MVADDDDAVVAAVLDRLLEKRRDVGGAADVLAVEAALGALVRVAEPPRRVNRQQAQAGRELDVARAAGLVAGREHAVAEDGDEAVFEALHAGLAVRPVAVAGHDDDAAGVAEQRAADGLDRPQRLGGTRARGHAGGRRVAEQDDGRRLAGRARVGP